MFRPDRCAFCHVLGGRRVQDRGPDKQSAAEYKGTDTTRSYLRTYQEKAIAARCRGARADTLAYADQCIEISNAAITWHVLRVASLVKLQPKRKATAAIGGLEKIIAA